MSVNESGSDDPNPYEALPISEVHPFQEITRPRPPGLLAIVFSVMLGLAIAAATFGITFFFTCLGVSSTTLGNDPSAIVIVFGVSGLTAIGAFVFTVWGLLKLGKLFKS